MKNKVLMVLKKLTIEKRNEANAQKEIKGSFKCQKMGHMQGAPGREVDDWFLSRAKMETDTGRRENAGEGTQAPHGTWTKHTHQVPWKEVAYHLLKKKKATHQYMEHPPIKRHCKSHTFQDGGPNHSPLPAQINKDILPENSHP